MVHYVNEEGFIVLHNFTRIKLTEFKETIKHVELGSNGTVTRVSLLNEAGEALHVLVYSDLGPDLARSDVNYLLELLKNE